MDAAEIVVLVEFAGCGGDLVGHGRRDDLSELKVGQVIMRVVNIPIQIEGRSHSAGARIVGDLPLVDDLTGQPEL